MNERTQQLAEQAGFVLWKDDSGNPGDIIDWSSSYNNELKKFAELIVRECIDWCNAHARDDGTAQRIAEDIKKDFGVEE